MRRDCHTRKQTNINIGTWSFKNKHLLGTT
uniref:Uncharacterized protein n=1 Tax=Rhizophora mucronata TaxID=61149 RepID=A0A2P2NX01_RHIMU